MEPLSWAGSDPAHLQAPPPAAPPHFQVGCLSPLVAWEHRHAGLLWLAVKFPHTCWMQPTLYVATRQRLCGAWEVPTAPTHEWPHCHHCPYLPPHRVLGPPPRAVVKGRHTLSKQWREKSLHAKQAREGGSRWSMHHCSRPMLRGIAQRPWAQTRQTASNGRFFCSAWNVTPTSRAHCKHPRLLHRALHSRISHLLLAPQPAPFRVSALRRRLGGQRRPGTERRLPN